MSVTPKHAESWAGQLATLREAARQSGLAEATVLVDAIERAAKDDVCTVAVLGEWSRGKSTLLNTMLERDLLPVDVRPTTASVVQIRHGEREHAVVLMESGGSVELPLSGSALRHAQTAASGGLETARRVDLVVRAPDIDGFRLVDTPGVNDLGETAHAIVYELLPFVDLAIFVIDATNGGLSRSEQAFLDADLLGPLRPPLAFVVNKMDGIGVDDDDEREELRAELLTQLRAVGGPAVPVLFGVARGALGRALRQDLLGVMRDAAAASVAQRRLRLVHHAHADLLSLFADRRAALELDEATIERRVARVDGARAVLPAALADFRAHARHVGEQPIRQMLARSLALHAERTGDEIERRIAMAGDLAAYARHGLLHDVSEASRHWAQAHVPEVTTYLRRHLAYLSEEFERNFGAVFGRGGGLRIRIPEPNPLPTIDVASIDQRQRQAENARYILPGLLSVVGGMIALPVGVAGLYIGMKMAADAREVQREALRAELQQTGRDLVQREEQRMRAGCDAMVGAYFADLDRQLEGSCTRVMEDARGRLGTLLEERRAGETRQAESLAKLDAAEALLDALALVDTPYNHRRGRRGAG